MTCFKIPPPFMVKLLEHEDVECCWCFSGCVAMIICCENTKSRTQRWMVCTQPTKEILHEIYHFFRSPAVQQNPGVIPTTQRWERIHIPTGKRTIIDSKVPDRICYLKEKKSLASRRSHECILKRNLWHLHQFCVSLYSKSTHKKRFQLNNEKRKQRSLPFFSCAPSFSPFHPFHPVLSEASCVKPHKSDWAMVAWS